MKCELLKTETMLYIHKVIAGTTADVKEFPFSLSASNAVLTPRYSGIYIAFLMHTLYIRNEKWILSFRRQWQLIKRYDNKETTLLK